MKKVGIVILSIVIICSIVGITIFIHNKQTARKTVYTNLKKTDIKEECEKPNNKYRIIFVTNYDSSLENIETCPTCEDQEIPIISQDNYDFDGWYYDKEFNNKINSNKIKDLSRKEIRKNNCLIGYEDITLYAKWIEKEQEQTEENSNDLNQEVAQIIQYDEPQAIEEQALSQDQITQETIPNVCEFKRPVDYGKFINYAIATHSNYYNPKYNFYIVTQSYKPIYSVTCGKVYFTKTYKSKFNYKYNYRDQEQVSDIYTLSNINGEWISIIYIEVAESNVKVNDIISNETVLGRAAHISKDIFVHRLPYINIYIQKGMADPYKSSGGETINPPSLISLPSNEYWEGR